MSSVKQKSDPLSVSACKVRQRRRGEFVDHSRDHVCEQDVPASEPHTAFPQPTSNLQLLQGQIWASLKGRWSYIDCENKHRYVEIEMTERPRHEIFQVPPRSVLHLILTWIHALIVILRGIYCTWVAERILSISKKGSTMSRERTYPKIDPQRGGDMLIASKE